jgi:flagellar motility protein MotE (MotC chaperone)
MTFIYHYLICLFVGTMVAFVSAAEIARALDNDEKEKKVEVNQIEQQQRAVERERANVNKSNKDQLERWMASPSGTNVNVRAQLETQLRNALEKLKSDCRPTESQVKKLELAGRGDIKRFLDRLEKAARDYDDTRGESDALQMIDVEVRRAKNVMSAGLFGEDSLFFKTLVKNDLRYTLSVARAVEALQGNIGLKDHQRTELLELIIRETRPPRTYGNASELAFVLFQASRISVDKLRRILNESQWREMSRWMTTYEQGAGSEAVLRRNGFVFDDEPILTLQERAETVTKDHAPLGGRTDQP